ncbi:MAG: hypothetical protein KGJ07_06670 [Patescibacteria group bacterium]|nr:hypothetical protein [Patescibacteria group bacterium]MDE2590695.1 hypothetical protein [Patescibacteria group bacterium]
MQPVFAPEFIGDFFSLHIHQTKNHTQIDMQVLPNLINTASLPNTYNILSSRLPSVNTSLCFNDKKLPFAKEVKRTETGHLFEHILLEHIYQRKVACGHKDVCVKGETSWNWHKFPTGFFSITINIGRKERDILEQALIPSIQLLQFIFAFHSKNHAGVKSVPILGKNITPSAMLSMFATEKS